MPANVELKKKICENDLYSLYVISVPDIKTDVYGIVNKENDVLEMSTSVLHNAKNMLKTLHEWETNPENVEDGDPALLPEIS